MIRNLYIVVLFFLTTGLLAESTENLMDYGSGTHLYSWQWHQIHNPPPAIPNIFQDSKEGMISYWDKEDLSIDFNHVELRDRTIKFVAVDSKSQAKREIGLYHALSVYDTVYKKEYALIVSKNKESKTDMAFIRSYLEEEEQPKKTDQTNVIVLCNGETSGGEKANFSYWGRSMVRLLRRYLGKDSYVRYKNGDVHIASAFWKNFSSSEIFLAGMREGKKDYEVLMDKLGQHGKFYFISHSKGASFCAGYLSNLVNKHNLKKGEDFPMGFHIMLAPYDFDDWNFGNRIRYKENHFAIRHDGDYFSSLSDREDANYRYTKHIPQVSSPTVSIEETQRLIIKLKRLINQRKLEQAYLKKAQKDAQKDAQKHVKKHVKKHIRQSKKDFNKSLNRVLEKKIDSLRNNGSSDEGIDRLMTDTISFVTKTKTKTETKTETETAATTHFILKDFLQKKDLEAFSLELMMNFDDNHTINGFYHELEVILKEYKKNGIWLEEELVKRIKANLRISLKKIKNSDTNRFEDALIGEPILYLRDDKNKEGK